MTLRHVMLAGVAAAAIACGGGSDGGGGGTPTTPTNPTNPPTATTTITITANGVNPQRITVPVGARVTFVNNDSRAHEMNSDPHPTHGDCPPLDAVGFLAPGQTKLSDAMNVARTCGFHDHTQPDVASLQGQIIVQ